MRWQFAANTHFNVVFTAVAEQYSEVACQGVTVRLGITMVHPHSLPQSFYIIILFANFIVTIISLYFSQQH